MPFTGVSHKVGEHIDTDAIIPARFLVTTDPKKLGENCMEGLEHGWVKRVQVGDILVAERNFGCGSSREHAPIAILGAGMKAVIAHSFARIFYRNAFNMGLLLLEIGDDVNKIKDGDKLEVSPEEGVIKNLTTGETTGIRMVGEYYCAALGTFYGTTKGTKYKVTLDTGKTFKIILCDTKSNRHTDKKHQYAKKNKDVVEFYVDRTKIPAGVNGNYNRLEPFHGKIQSIELLTEWHSAES